MPVFPSTEWFQEAADRLNASDSFERLGSCDAEVGVRVGDRCFAITFDAFAITDVAEVPCDAPGDLDFILLQSPDQWRAMLEIFFNYWASYEIYTLNSLDLQHSDGLA
ncbi:MAG: PAC2 family protein, partial [Dehalococcoidia bacterium]|nr:PAC2 family protein [Dehalococcoidia bacterium]